MDHWHQAMRPLSYVLARCFTVQQDELLKSFLEQCVQRLLTKMQFEIRTMMAFFLSRFIYCRKCRQNTQTLLTAESGTHGNLDLFLGVSKEHYHADDDVTINIKRIPLGFFFKVD